VIDIVPANEEGEAAEARIEKREWLKARDYRILEASTADIVRDVGGLLERLADAVNP